MSGIVPTPDMPGAGGGIGLDTRRLSSRANLEAAGQQFEAVFTGMMLKAMRQAKLGSDLFQSKGMDTFRDMQDQQVVKAMASGTPLGIGKAMTDFLARSTPDLQEPKSDSGGAP